MSEKLGGWVKLPFMGEKRGLMYRCKWRYGISGEREFDELFTLFKISRVVGQSRCREVDEVLIACAQGIDWLALDNAIDLLLIVGGRPPSKCSVSNAHGNARQEVGIRSNSLLQIELCVGAVAI